MRKRASEYGLTFGDLPRGPFNAINDIPGVRVGQHTVWCDEPAIGRTGVTVIIPGDGDLYQQPVTAATLVINGYGKSAGLLQVEEMGAIETPIALTNTLQVSTAADALIDFTLENHPDCLSANAVVGECNDGRLNDIRARLVTPDHVKQALASAAKGAFETGSVGAGTGMVCYGYKGGIGTASRMVTLNGRPYTIGVLTLTNFGMMRDLVIKGRAIAPCCPEIGKEEKHGSIMIILGTDIPLTYRQLRRLAHRVPFGIARTGGHCGGQSGEFVIAFSNGHRKPKDGSDLYSFQGLVEAPATTQPLFDAVIDSVEEAIIDSLFTAETVTGVKGHTAHALPVEEILKSVGNTR